jgi:hypothetical protein
VLPKNHKLTQLIIHSEHLKQLHAGPQASLASVRQNYWPLSGRDAVRQVLFKCIENMEKVQHRFFKFIRWKLLSQISHSYSLSMCYLGLATLDVRRKHFALCFMYKIIHNLIDVIDLTQLLNFYVPQFPARNVPTFKLQHCRTNYMLYSSLNSLLRVCNMYADSIDLFWFHSYSIFRRHIKAILRC